MDKLGGRTHKERQMNPGRQRIKGQNEEGESSSKLLNYISFTNTMGWEISTLRKTLVAKEFGGTEDGLTSPAGFFQKN